MIKKIFMKNFKSFGNIECDFTGSGNKPKKVIAIYGENGSGKSNLISSIKFLNEVNVTLNLRKSIEEQMLMYNNNIVHNVLQANYDLKSLIQQYKMIDSNDNMELEYTFDYNEKDIIYKMIFDDEKIIYESLKFPFEKNMIDLFRITQTNIYFNSGIFLDKKYEKEIKEKVLKYFSLHSFLSILSSELTSLNKSYIELVISKEFLNVINVLFNIPVSYRDIFGNSGFSTSNMLPTNLTNGIILKKNINKLQKNEKILNLFFISFYSDIKKVYYKLEENENNVKYELTFEKVINGSRRSINWKKESYGTFKLLLEIPYILDCLNGKTVFIDEIDNGIHDILMETIIKSLITDMKGQVIFTTHNTLLMNSLDPKYVYILDSDYKGNKTLNCVKDFERIQKNNSLRKKYLDGIYGGVPNSDDIDLNDIFNNGDGE